MAISYHYAVVSGFHSVRRGCTLRIARPGKSAVCAHATLQPGPVFRTIPWMGGVKLGWRHQQMQTAQINARCLPVYAAFGLAVLL